MKLESDSCITIYERTEMKKIVYFAFIMMIVGSYVTYKESPQTAKVVREGLISSAARLSDELVLFYEWQGVHSAYITFKEYKEIKSISK